jgi:hypothetical protein
MGDRLADVGRYGADDEVAVVAVEQLVGLLHADADIRLRVLVDHLDLAAENPVLRVELVNRHRGADQLVGPQRRIGAGERIDEADLHGVGGAGLPDHVRRGEGSDTKPGAGTQHAAPRREAARLVEDRHG